MFGAFANKYAPRSDKVPNEMVPLHLRNNHRFSNNPLADSSIQKSVCLNDKRKSFSKILLGFLERSSLSIYSGNLLNPSQIPPPAFFIYRCKLLFHVFILPRQKIKSQSMAEEWEMGNGVRNGEEMEWGRNGVRSLSLACLDFLTLTPSRTYQPFFVSSFLSRMVYPY